MATVLGLALKVSADASGVQKSLTPVQRAIQQLDTEAKKVTDTFKQFEGTSAGAGAAQQRFATDLGFLNSALRTGQIDARQYAEEFATLEAAAKATGEAFAEGVLLTEQNRSAEEMRAEQLKRLEELLQLGAISQETFNRAAAEASGANKAAADAEAQAAKVRADAVAEAARITDSVVTEQEKRQASLTRLSELLAEGLVSEETYQRAVEKTAGASGMAAEAEKQRQALLDEAKRVTDSVATEEEKRAAKLANLQELLDANAISQETFNRAAAEASGANKAAADAAAEAAKVQADADKTRGDQATRAAAIVEANLSREEKAQRDFGVATRELNALRNKGLLTEQEYSTALRRVAGDYAKATLAADKFGKTAEKAGDAGTIKFNELTGALGLIPGPLGSVAAKISSFSSAAEGLGKVMKNPIGALGQLSSTLSFLLTPAGLVTAAIGSVAAAATAVVSGLSAMEAQTERLTNTAEKLGVSFAFMQTLQQAAEMSGVSFEAVNSSMGKLLRTLAGADEESKAANAALDRLGITLDDLQGKDTEQQFRIIGERLKDIEEPAKRAAAATAIFGKSGSELLPFFNNLGIAEQTLARFNARLSQIDATRVLSLGDSFDGVKAAVAGLGNELLTPFIGITQSISDGLAPVLATLGKNIGAILDIFSPITSAIGLVVNGVLQFAAVASNLINTVLEPLATSGRLISEVFDSISRAVTSVYGNINDAISGFREFFKFESAAASFRETMNSISEVISRIAVIAQVAFGKFVTFVGEAFGDATKYVQETVASFIEFTGLGSALSAIGSTISSVFGSVSKVFSTIASSIGGTVGRLLTMAENFLGIERAAEDASAGVDKTTKSVETLSKEQVKALSELAKEIENSDKALNTAIDKASEFGQAGFEASYQFQEALAELKDQAADLELDAEQYARGVANATAEYEKQIKAIEKVADANKKATEEATRDAEKKAADDKKRIDELLNPNEGANKVEKEIAFVIEQQAESQRLLADARGKNDKASADSAAARLAQLDQLRSKLEDQAAAIDQGFSDGFSSAFRKTSEELSGLVDQAGKLGQAGVEAGVKLQEGVAKAQEQAKAGIITKDVYDRELAAQRKVFEERVAQVEKVRELEKQNREASFKAQIDANERVNQFLTSRISSQQQAEIASADAVARRKQESQLNIEAIKARLVTEETALQAAREQNDLKSARAGQSRIDELEKAKLVEEKIAEGKTKNIQKQQQLAEYQKAYQEQQLAAANAYQQQQQKAQEAYAAEQAKIFEEQQKAAAAEAKRQEERLTKLNTLGQQSIALQDVRTTEGANLVLQLSANGQDPSLIQQRLQTKYLEEMNTNLRQAALNYFNSPVAIVGGPPILRPR